MKQSQMPSSSPPGIDLRMDRILDQMEEYDAWLDAWEHDSTDDDAEGPSAIR
jgi:hypothetical protein